MGAKKYPIRLKFRVKLTADGTGEITSERINHGEVLACQSIAFRNQTGARGTLELFIRQMDALTFIADQTSPAANRWYWYPYTQHIKEGEAIKAEQASCLTNDILDLQIIGYKTYSGEGDIQ